MVTIISKVSVTLNSRFQVMTSATTATASSVKNRHFETDVSWNVLTRIYEQKLTKNLRLLLNTYVVVVHAVNSCLVKKGNVK